MENLTGKAKSFWQRKEGFTGTLLLIGAGILGLKVAPAIIAFLTGLFTSLLTMVGLAFAAVIGCVSFYVFIRMLLSPRFHAFAWYALQMVSRKITSAFVRIDPIIILKSYVKSLSNKISEMESQMESLKGQIRNLANLIKTNKNTSENEMLVSKKAQDQKNKKQFLLSTNKAARLKDSNERLEKLHKKLSGIYDILCRYRERAEFIMLDTKDKVDIVEIEFNATKKANGAMKTAMRLLMGGEHKEMYDEAMDYVVETTGNQVGEIERFLDVSKNLVDNIDLQNAIYEDKGMKIFEEWEKEESIVLGTDKTLLIDRNGGIEVNNYMPITPDLLKQDQINREAQKNTYTDLFNQ